MALGKKAPTALSGACLTMPTKCGLSVIEWFCMLLIKFDRYHVFHVTAMVSKQPKRSLPAGYAAVIGFCVICRSAYSIFCFNLRAMETES
jgi:hypothetical protein